MNRLNYIVVIVFAAALLTGCMVGPKYERKDPAMPDQYRMALSADTSALDTDWFNLFGDTVLVKLIRYSLDSNRNLMQALNQIEEARLFATNARNNLYPGIGYNVSGGISQVGSGAQKTGAALDGGAMRLLGSVNWEIDLWGRLRRLSKVAQLRVLQNEAVRNNLQISLISEIAGLYFLLRDLDNRKNIVLKTIELREENARILKARFEEGYIAELDKLQADAQLAVAEAILPSINRQITTTENLLTLLAGSYADSIPRGLSNYDQVFNATVKEGLPSQLLRRRPDVAAAEIQLNAQSERIGIATADLYPTVSFTGLLGFASPQLSSLFGGKGGVASANAGLLGPIFQWGNIRRNIEVEKIRTNTAFLQYEQTLLTAFREVNDALVGYKTFSEENDIRRRQVEATEKALQLSRARYDYGFTSYLEVLVQENNLLDAQLSESVSLANKHSSMVQLYRALGGGW